MSISTVKSNRPWQPDARYITPSRARTLWLLASSIVPYLGLLYGMRLSLDVSYWLALALAPLTAGFMVRVFIVFHDTTHGSIFKNRIVNDIVGTLTGVLMMSPFRAWRHGHAVHHAQAGNLDARETGDIWTLTLDEYRALSWRMRLWYRTYRNPLFLFFPGGILFHLVVQRFPRRGAPVRDVRNVWFTNVLLVAYLTGMFVWFGALEALVVYLPVMVIGTAVGVWLQFVQHQYEGVYWARKPEWDYQTASLEGSSYLKLPKIMQWFTGNIGLHHIHHLCPRIPNYYLQACLDRYEILRNVRTLNLRDGLSALNLHLLDETNQRMLTFREAAALA